MGLFPTKFVCDVDVLEYTSSSTVTMTMTVGGTTVLTEKYSPANGQIVVRGLRSVLEAAIHGDLTVGTLSAAKADVAVTIDGSQVASKTLYASRLKNPRDPSGSKTVLAAGDLTAVYVTGDEALRISPLLTTINGSAIATIVDFRVNTFVFRQDKEIVGTCIEAQTADAEYALYHLWIKRVRKLQVVQSQE